MLVAGARTHDLGAGQGGAQVADGADDGRVGVAAHCGPARVEGALGRGLKVNVHAVQPKLSHLCNTAQ